MITRLLLRLHWRAAQQHRIYVLEHLALDTDDVLAARLVLETDPATVAVIRAALNERRSVHLVISHVYPLHDLPELAPNEPPVVFDTAEYDPFIND